MINDRIIRSMTLFIAVVSATILFLNLYTSVGDYAFLVYGLSVILFALTFGGHRAVEFGFIALILWFAVGYNSYPIQGSLRVHGLDLIIIVISVIYVIRRESSAQVKITNINKWEIRFLLIAIIYGAIVGFSNGIAWNEVVNEGKNYALGIPVLFFLPNLVRNREIFKKMMIALAVAGLLIAIPGIIDYYGGYVIVGSKWGDAFDRAVFPLWGAPTAVLVMVVCFQGHYYLLDHYKSISIRIIILSSAAIQLVALYYSGTRSMWWATITTLVVIAQLRYGWKRMILILPVLVFMLYKMPVEAEARLTSFYFLHLKDKGVISAEAFDSSGAIRARLIDAAWDRTISSPWGSGWASSGWVHSDFLQFSANIGLFPGIVFFMYFVAMTLKALLFTIKYRREDEGLWYTVIGLAITVIFHMLVGGVSQLIQYMMPTWVGVTIVIAVLKQKEANIV